jgi:GNAT superfamily N-acetyltransferase
MLYIRLMTAADIPAAMALVRAAGWNQTEVDWQRALDLEPAGCYLAEWEGKPAGTATACVFGQAAWIALVLVDAAQRQRGIGTALMQHTLADLDRRGVRSVCLTATPMGQPIYEKLGFVGEYRLVRYEGVLPPAEPVAGVESVAPADLDALAELERITTGIDRRKLLARQYAEQREATRQVRRAGRVRGFMMTRVGSRAVYLGPCLADVDAGPLLLADAFHRYAGQLVFLDIPLEHAAALALAEARRLTRQRELYRMWRGPAIAGSLQGLWASWGPEKG